MAVTPGFSEQLRQSCATDWRACVQHRFVEEIFAGTLDDAVLRRYLVQDYQFINRFVALLGAAIESGASLTVRERIEHSPDPVRLGGVGHVLRERLQPHLKSEVRTTVLGHVQRGGDPTPYDRVLATRYGHKAAQLVLERRFGRMVTLQNGQIGSVEIARVANTQRTVPLDHELLTMARDIGICLGEAG